MEGAVNMKRNTTITRERLNELLYYDAISGNFTWIVARNSRGGKIKIGSMAGSLSHYGYVDIRIDGNLFKAHRLAWFLVHSEWPETDIDHINRDKSDNRISNLRLAGRSQNNVNSGIPRNNTSGYKGVWWHKSNERWVAETKFSGKKVCFGYFRSKEDAAAARSVGMVKLFGEFAIPTNP